jgi:hypothetical protein
MTDKQKRQKKKIAAWTAVKRAANSRGGQASVLRGKLHMQRLGARGGLTTLLRYGAEHFREMARRSYLARVAREKVDSWD